MSKRAKPHSAVAELTSQLIISQEAHRLTAGKVVGAVAKQKVAQDQARRMRLTMADQSRTHNDAMRTKDALVQAVTADLFPLLARAADLLQGTDAPGQSAECTRLALQLLNNELSASSFSNRSPDPATIAKILKGFSGNTLRFVPLAVQGEERGRGDH